MAVRTKCPSRGAKKATTPKVHQWQTTPETWTCARCQVMLRLSILTAMARHRRTTLEAMATLVVEKCGVAGAWEHQKTANVQAAGG